jgi:F-type H+-transporting ATPase subunit gamma
MNLRVVRKKIKAVNNVKKITQAMEMVSAIKMKKNQQIATQAKPYQEFLENSINNIINSVDKNVSELLKPNIKSLNKNLVVLVSSNKGLCGGFNINLIRHLLKTSDYKNTDILSLGKKGASLANNVGYKIIADFSSNNMLENVSPIFSYALEQYLKGLYSNVTLFYNSFESLIKYIPTSYTLLPLTYRTQVQNQEIREFIKTYLIEPDPEEIMHSLLINYLEEKIRFSIIQTQAGEHSARMIAMKNATDNATDVLFNLTLLRNKLRQQKITLELLDIITSKELIESKN